MIKNGHRSDSICLQIGKTVAFEAANLLLMLPCSVPFDLTIFAARFEILGDYNIPLLWNKLLY